MYAWDEELGFFGVGVFFPRTRICRALIAVAGLSLLAPPALLLFSSLLLLLLLVVLLVGALPLSPPPLLLFFFFLLLLEGAIFDDYDYDCWSDWEKLQLQVCFGVDVP